MREVSKMLGVSRPCILKWISDGLITPSKEATPYTPAGFVYRFSASDLRKMKAQVVAMAGRGRPKPLKNTG